MTRVQASAAPSGAAAPRAGGVPVAIVGMGCRFPGARDVAAFWALLRDGVDAVREVPAERWNLADFYDPREDAPGKMVTRWGGFVDDVDQFDAEFFGISRREAERMDPQQRLVMETAWAALEDAGISPHSLRGGDAGVFVGIGNTDYMRMLCRDPDRIDRYDGTGSTPSFAANRLSYFLDLHGPSLGMESACSSSLVALHVACRSLREGETSLAIAGGVNLVLSPDMTVAFSQARMMSPTGRCRAFDADADGYVRGEGCGVVILKRLDDALAAGDRILAVIRGSAVNQDGTSNGITAPNGQAQQAVIRRACADAGVAPARIGYVEAHGTGTKVGDPIEMRALQTVLGEGRAPDAWCRVGSVKTNIGHLEAAAGIAGLIKTVLVLRHRQIPPHLHLHTLNPYLALDGTPFEIPRTLTSWPDGDAPRVAGLSGFSFGGTNCHLIVEEAPVETPRAQPADAARVCLLPLSARSLPALRALADAFARGLNEDRTACEPSPLAALAALGRTAALGRAHFPHRLAVTANSRAQLATRLSGWLDGRADWGGVQRTAARHASPDLVFMMTGQGAGQVGAGQGLYREQPAFRRAVERCDDVLRALGAPGGIGRLLRGEGPPPRADDPEQVQPAVFVLGYALAELWRAWGIRPRAVLGHSLGEYVAACVAGAVDLEPALALVAARGRLTAALAEPGGMAVLFASAETVSGLLAREPGRLALAAFNGPQATVVSGDAAALDALLQAGAAQRIEGRRLDTTHAFHSPLMQPMVEAFRAEAARVDWRPPSIPLVAGLTGTVWPAGSAPDADYWCRHLLEPVRFVDSLRGVTAGGAKLLLELGAGAALTRLGARGGYGEAAHFIASLPPDRDESGALLDALGVLYAHGKDVDWRGVYGREDARPVPLPGYPFQRQRYWYTDTPAAAGASAMGAANEPAIAERPPHVDGAPAAPARAAHADDHRAPGVGARAASAVAIASPALRADAPVRHAPPAASRDARILAILIAEFGRLLHGDPDALDPDASFLELGADSLVLVDAVHRIEQRFGIQISARQLFSDIPTPRALAAHLAALAPAGDEADEADARERPASGTPETTATTADRAALIDLIRQQQRLLAQQLALLQASAEVTPVPAARQATPFALAAAAAIAPSAAAVPAALSPTQRRYLDQLTARYVARTGGSRARAAASRAALADSRASAGFRPSIKEMLYPIVGSHGAGACFHDVDGNAYLDLTMGFGVSLFGHQPDFVGAALTGQWQRGLQVGPQSPLAGEVAELIRDLTGVERVAFCNTGTEAVMTAVRLARAATGRTKVALFSGAYHGHADGLLVAAPGRPGSAGVTPGAVADVLMFDYGEPHALEQIEACAGELAAILVEPVQSRRPELQPRAFLRRLREIANAHGAALVFDEVLTGFRIHPGGAQAWFDVRADLVAYGKIVGGGLPIGVVGGRARFLDGIDGGAWDYGDASGPHAETVFFAGTFNKNHLTMATARAVLTHLKAAGPALQETLNARTARLADTLNTMLASRGAPVRVAHFGSLFRFQVSGNLDPFFYGLVDKGLYVWEGRTCFLSTAHTEADLATIVERVTAVVDELAQAGWFGAPAVAADDAAAAADAAAAVALPSSAALGQDLAGTLALLRARHDLGTYARGMAWLERRAVEHIDAAFVALGHRAQPGAVVTDEGLAAELGVVSAQRRLFGRLLQILAEEGRLEADGPGRWRARAASAPIAAGEPASAEGAAVAHERGLLERCGAALADVLRGARHPLEVLAPGGDLAPLRTLYTASPMARAMNTLARDAVAAAVRAAPADATVRLLEVGAGTGGTTAYVVPALPAGRVEYVFSDLSPRFLDDARRQFAEYPFMAYRLLDIEQPPRPDEQADIVIAANVLHATADLGRTLDQLRARLRPGGLLFVLEGSGRARWLDLVFGLTDGWWLFADHAVRPDYPLLDADAWLDQLAAHGFADAVALRSGERDGPGAQTLLIAGAARRFALSPIQHAIWVASRVGPPGAYHESLTVRLGGAPDREALAQAVRLLLRRHDALRMRVDADGAHQRIGPPGDGLVPVALPAGEPHAQARAWLDAELARPFDLTTEPPVRFHLLDLGDDAHDLVVSAHHVLLDGLSLVTLARELGQAYAALATGGAPAWSAAPSFAAHLERTGPAAQPARWAASRDYWRARLAPPLPRIALPLDRPRSARRPHLGARLRGAMPAGLGDTLTALATAHGCTLFMVLLAGFRVLLHGLAGPGEALVGISAAGQSADGEAALVGCCVNVLPLRLADAPEQRVDALLAAVRGEVLDACDHQWVSLAEIAADLDLPRDAGRPLIDVHFNYDKVEGGVGYGPLAVAFETNHAGAARRDLTWNPVEVDGQLALIVDYDADLFDAATVEGWMDDYAWLLARMAAQPDLSIAALASERAARRAQALAQRDGARLRTARRRAGGPA
ncbi:aminotransferase class III-fold pyridoxal phosphate-dependent enzyme [Burkholderia sp. FERM BP-3421]|uniref:type I polyketide synthase n=1 Tax=Burkholderia sp. FERM BP-3421 TaxID=1494466 RepID=UPI00235FE77A|nr:type I polyketide synthase [Burkholderia sp. FERM BP-3421]WDD92626.1 aminotransferase class III-fold pyridoxal phosphate-dependent enzyme [Burkholderia sp. FERM BP-3421]